MGQRIAQFLLRTSLAVVAVGPVLAATEPNDQTTDPRFVLEQVRKRLAAISNYQCVELRNGKAKHLAYSSQGHGRVRESHDNREATSLTWDGARTIEVHERLLPNGTPRYSASILPGKLLGSYHGNRPWYALGALFADMLAKAIEDNRDVSIAPTEDGHCRVQILLETSTVMATLLDPRRGYLPVRNELFVHGILRRHWNTDFRQVQPGIWFPNHEFRDVQINDPGFDRLLEPDLPDGSTVADEVRGARYVVDHAHGLTLTDRATASTSASPAPAPGPEGLYSLDANQVLKRIAPVSPAARGSLIGTSDADREQVPEAALYNTIHVFQWDDSNHATVSYTGNGFLKLSEILLRICGLGIGEFSGAEDLLELRLTGDWIVRRDATMTERIHALEHIVREETGLNVIFENRRVEASVARATGIFRYHPLPGARGEDDVQLFAEPSVEEDRTYTGSGHGTLAQLLRHVTNRTGKRFVDDTLSSDISVSWSDYKSSELDPLRLAGTTYRYDLAQLLENVAQQTGLKLTAERRTIDEWHVSVGP